jgi:4'-phosphopantetheinyl transferase
MNIPDVVWTAAPNSLKPAEGAVDVFCAPLDVPAKRLEELSQLLSPDEWRRAGRIHHERDWRRFLVGRGTLREILGQLLNVNPARLEFSNGIFGKPQIAAPVAAQSLHFNLAHSDSLVVYATSRHELGVDIEHIREMEEADQIASRFFSPRETNCLHGLPAEQRLEAFFNCWTRKEAYLKALGRGLDDNLDQIEVSLAPGEPAELLPPHASRQWSLHTLAPAPEFVGALAIQEQVSRVNCWRWTGIPDLTQQ